MPKGPQGQKRPGNVIGAAIMVAKIAAGEINESASESDKAHTRKGGKKAGGSGRSLSRQSRDLRLPGRLRARVGRSQRGRSYAASRSPSSQNRRSATSSLKSKSIGIGG